MSKHWNPRFVESGRRPRGRRPRRRAATWRVSAAEVRLVLLGGLFAGLVVAQLSNGSSSGTEDEAWRQAPRVRIVDGDTFWYGGEKIRIADIDTPEVRGRCPYETQLAAQATNRMSALLAAGPFELHAVERDTDRYGRKLRVVTRGGRSLGDQLVAEGLARTWTGRREPWC